MYPARHGPIALNAEGWLRGLIDPPLTEVALAEVQRLGDMFARRHPFAVISGPPSPRRRQSAPTAITVQ